LVVVPQDAGDERATVGFTPNELDGSKTVMLQAVDVVGPEPIEVTEAFTPPPPPPPKPKPKPTAEDDDEGGGIKKGKLEETEMDMTPMVDVTFLLLIFFMVTAAFTLQKSIDVPKPQTDQASEQTVDEEQDESDRVTVQVDEFNTYHVLTVDWEEEAPSEHEMLQHLKLARDGDSTGKVPTSLLVEASEDALHEKVVAALDAGSQTGFAEVLLATVESE
jgi:biopolymer transport protein ExbD